jgi:hypothetical protein
MAASQCRSTVEIRRNPSKRFDDVHDRTVAAIGGCATRWQPIWHSATSGTRLFSSADSAQNTTEKSSAQANGVVPAVGTPAIVPRHERSRGPWPFFRWNTIDTRSTLS